MLRDIINHEGVVVGQISFPDTLSEAEIEAKLAVYATAPAVPQIADVTPRQIRQALILSGVLMADIDSALASLPEPTRSLAQTEWEYSVSFKRSRPLVDSVRQMLGWTNAQVDALWALANTL